MFLIPVSSSFCIRPSLYSSSFPCRPTLYSSLLFSRPILRKKALTTILGLVCLYSNHLRLTRYRIQEYIYMYSLAGVPFILSLLCGSSLYIPEAAFMNVKLWHNFENSQTWFSVYNVYITNQFQHTFARGGGGG